MTDFLHIQPAQEQRRAFARWAVAQDPMLRTVGPNTFEVPAEAFAQAPEEILIGAMVNGHRYVSPEEDAREGRAAPGENAPETEHGAPLPEQEAVPGEPLPELPDTAYGPDAVPLDPSDAEGEEAEAGATTDEAVPYGCDVCPKTFSSERGRDSHRRIKHAGA
ncbi:hypothetical protein ACFV5J_26520 [Streptomyces zaomyceticus]|uniref:hypothetical protein n=1 Tax=Streptomyces zaomyceticus TaxID=68286 RepID=UPI003662F165